MGRRLSLLLLQFAAVVIFVVAALHLLTLISVFGDTLKTVEKVGTEGAVISQNTAIVIGAMLMAKECLTLAVAVAAFRYARYLRSVQSKKSSNSAR